MAARHADQLSKSRVAFTVINEPPPAKFNLVALIVEKPTHS